MLPGLGRSQHRSQKKEPQPEPEPEPVEAALETLTEDTHVARKDEEKEEEDGDIVFNIDYESDNNASPEPCSPPDAPRRSSHHTETQTAPDIHTDAAPAAQKQTNPPHKSILPAFGVPKPKPADSSGTKNKGASDDEQSIAVENDNSVSLASTASSPSQDDSRGAGGVRPARAIGAPLLPEQTPEPVISINASQRLLSPLWKEQSDMKSNRQVDKEVQEVEAETAADEAPDESVDMSDL